MSFVNGIICTSKTLDVDIYIEALQIRFNPFCTLSHNGILCFSLPVSS